MNFSLEGEFTDLNTHIQALSINRYLGGKIKRKETNRAAWYFKGKRLEEGKCYNFVFKWYCKNKRTDPDNIAFAKKYILDGMVMVGFIKTDGWECVKGFTDKFDVDSNNPRVEIEIYAD